MATLIVSILGDTFPAPETLDNGHNQVHLFQLSSYSIIFLKIGDRVEIEQGLAEHRGFFQVFPNSKSGEFWKLEPRLKQCVVRWQDNI